MGNNYYQNLSFHRDPYKAKIFLNKELYPLTPTVCERVNLMLEKLNKNVPQVFTEYLEIRKNSIPVVNIEFEDRYPLDAKYDIN